MITMIIVDNNIKNAELEMSRIKNESSVSMFVWLFVFLHVFCFSVFTNPTTLAGLLAILFFSGEAGTKTEKTTKNQETYVFICFS